MKRSKVTKTKQPKIKKQWHRRRSLRSSSSWKTWGLTHSPPLSTCQWIGAHWTSQTTLRLSKSRWTCRHLSWKCASSMCFQMGRNAHHTGICRSSSMIWTWFGAIASCSIRSAALSTGMHRLWREMQTDYCTSTKSYSAKSRQKLQLKRRRKLMRTLMTWQESSILKHNRRAKTMMVTRVMSLAYLTQKNTSALTKKCASASSLKSAHVTNSLKLYKCSNQSRWTQLRTSVVINCSWDLTASSLMPFSSARLSWTSLNECKLAADMNPKTRLTSSLLL